MYLPSKKIRTIVFAIAIALLVFNSFKDTFQSIAISLSSSFFSLSRSTYQTKIDQLQKQNLNCQLKLDQYKNLAKENQALREALDFKNKENLNLVGAEIIAFSPSSWQQYIFLNSGQDKKIKKGMVVIDKNGNLIGKIKEVYKKRSKVILIKNPDFQIPVVLGDQALGLLQGTLSGVEILYVEKSNKLNLSELVYTAASPVASSVRIGKISSIKKSKNSLFYEIQVDIFAKDKLPQVVFILK
ncbi:MAG: rod shape-determining protein MreC [Candidatus Omnitrophica bacterium]|nr:rod shape-determining protein MreC [Candidatus Omnitrophota bacterium]